MMCVLAPLLLAAALPGPCLPTASTIPKFHVSGMGIGPHDANAIFKHLGKWHIMHQANWTDWAHLVSDDLVRWTRVKSALSPNGDWDGSLTILDGKPVIIRKTREAFYVPPGITRCEPSTHVHCTAFAKVRCPSIVHYCRVHVGVPERIAPSTGSLVLCRSIRNSL